MNIEPLLDAPLAIRLHVASVVPAALIGPYIFWAGKGTPIHRLLGKVWLGLMLLAAASSFFIHTLNWFFGFGPIHLISVFVFYGAWQAYRAARAHRIGDHKRIVTSLYLGGIVGAGAFTLLPERLMHEVAFSSATVLPDASKLAVFFAAMFGILLVLLIFSRLPHSRR